jgi:hypothetical protein
MPIDSASMLIRSLAGSASSASIRAPTAAYSAVSRWPLQDLFSRLQLFLDAGAAAR